VDKKSAHVSRKILFFSCVACFTFFLAPRVNAQTYPFQNPALPIETRVNNIDSLLTQAEKISLLPEREPAISRLGLNAFTYYSEGLHGLGSGGNGGGSYTATQFCQAYGLGETWDVNIMQQAGAQIASLVQQSQQITNAMQGALSPSATASYQAQLNIISQQIQSLAAQGGPDAINAAKQSATVQSDTPNAIVLNIPFDIHCELTGAGRTVERVLRHCLLISNEQVYDQSGQTLLDCYGFVARSAN